MSDLSCETYHLPRVHGQTRSINVTKLYKMSQLCQMPHLESPRNMYVIYFELEKLKRFCMVKRKTACVQKYKVAIAWMVISRFRKWQRRITSEVELCCYQYYVDVSFKFTYFNCNVVRLGCIAVTVLFVIKGFIGEMKLIQVN